MKIIKMMILLMATAVATTAAPGPASQNAIKGNGKIVGQEREIKSFSRLEISGAFDVTLVQGNTEELFVEADENLQDLIITEVHGSTLKIHLKESVRQAEEMKLNITFRELESIEINGATQIKGEGMLTFGELEVKSSGATQATLNLTADVLKLDLSGASETDLAGKCGKLIAEASGACDIDAEELECDIVKVDISGACSARVNAKDEIDAEASGASRVRYEGNPEKVYTGVSGVSSVKPVK